MSEHKRPTAEEIAARNVMVRRLRARGMTQEAIAKEVALTARQVRTILKRAYAKRIEEVRTDADTLLASIAEGYEEDIRELSAIAANGEQPGAVRVGALRVRAEAREKWMRVLQSLGLGQAEKVTPPQPGDEVHQYRVHFDNEQLVADVQH